jgi:hypothetical protein
MEWNGMEWNGMEWNPNANIHAINIKLNMLCL